MPKIFLLIGMASLGFFQQDSEKIKANRNWSISISEPSDICPSPLNNHFFIVSDRGFLFETDSSYKPIRRTNRPGMDYEGVFADSHFVYAVEERTRKINQFDIHSLELVKSRIIPYAGGRNAGYEGFTFNPVRNSFVLITEKSPIWIFELDKNLNLINEFKLKEKLFPKTEVADLTVKSNLSFSKTWQKLCQYGGPSDASSIGFYHGKLFILSDEDSELLQLNAKTFELEKRWQLGILNPEGFYLDPKGNLFVMSDNLQKIYQFSTPLH